MIFGMDSPLSSVLTCEPQQALSPHASPDSRYMELERLLGFHFARLGIIAMAAMDVSVYHDSPEGFSEWALPASALPASEWRRHGIHSIGCARERESRV